MEEPSKFPAIVELNVGGQHFTTTLLTLTKCKDNMLAAMFSGKYSVMKDDNGRYFIDADGNHFLHILNYLRYGDLPPTAMAEPIYREALYFGVNGLIEELEKYPCIMGKIQRNSFRNKFPGYGECLDALIMAAGSPTCKTTSSVMLLLSHRENSPEHVHNCKCPFKDSSNRMYTGNVHLGPWANDCSEKDVMNCLMFDLESQGFIVTSHLYGLCVYEVDGYRCEKPFYKISFHWWKS